VKLRFNTKYTVCGSLFKIFIFKFIKAVAFRIGTIRRFSNHKKPIASLILRFDIIHVHVR